MSTATISEPISGPKLYQQRARKALPLLVRQAQAGNTVYYSELADELGMPNPRNLNFVLGSIGQTIENLAKDWKKPVPPIQCVVVNRATGLPGEGIGWFLVKKEDFVALPREDQEAVVNAHLENIFAYPYWSEVLSALSIAPAPALINKVELPNFGGSGEGPEHKALKEYVAKHPEVVGMHQAAAPGRTEDPLLSGDSLDVSFTHGRKWVAVEVKSHISSYLDIQRGLFQCVKYSAVMKAQTRALGTNFNVRAVLLLGGVFPKGLQPLRNMLGIEVIDGVLAR